MKHLHVLNGDATATQFKRTRIAGDYIVWRELLSEGPVIYDETYEKFWKTRIEFLGKTYGDSDSKCKLKVLDEFRKLDNFADYDEVILWFEHDLACQINLMFLLNWFSTKELGNTKLSLICLNQYPGIGNFRGLGQLSPGQLSKLLPKRQTIRDHDLQFAALIWKAYCSSDPRQLERLVNSEDFSRFPYLKNVLVAHLQRFPWTDNGLNKIERELLAIVTNGADSENAIIQEMLDRDKVLGVTDLQIKSQLKRLGPLLGSNGTYQISQLGMEVLQNRRDFLSINSDEISMGGASNLEYRWNQKKNRIVESG